MKHVKLSILLITSILVATTTSAFAQDAPKPKLPTLLLRGLNAPVVTPWPQDLPKAFEGKDLAICLPQPTARQVARRLQLLDVFPNACQDVIIANRKHEMEKSNALLESCRARRKIDVVNAVADAEAGWKWHEVALVAIGAVGAGFLSGWVMGTAGVAR